MNNTTNGTSSVLTEALDKIELHYSTMDRTSNATTKVIQKIETLKRLDYALQTAHVEAKKDNNKGEKVVALYVQFKREREDLVSELQQQKISIPWQLHLCIAELEETVKECPKEMYEQYIKENPVDQSGETATPIPLGKPIQANETTSISWVYTYLLPTAIALLFWFVFTATNNSSTQSYGLLQSIYEIFGSLVKRVQNVLLSYNLFSMNHG